MLFKIKPSLFLLLLLLIGFSFVNEPDTDFIPWEADSKLKWSDFHGKAQMSSSHDALSHCGLSMDMSMQGGEISFIVKAVFDRKQSWVKNAESSSELLAHEQLHFDIYEQYARELRKRLSESTFNEDAYDVSRKTNKVYKEVNKELLLAQQNYDKETDHSLVKTKQMEWESRVASKLKKLNNFSETAFDIQISK
jgi:hypothetical protein